MVKPCSDSTCPIACAISAVAPCCEAADTSTLGTCARSGAPAAASVIVATSLVEPCARSRRTGTAARRRPLRGGLAPHSACSPWSCWPRPVRLTLISGFHRCSARPGQFGLHPKGPRSWNDRSTRYGPANEEHNGAARGMKAWWMSSRISRRMRRRRNQWSSAVVCPVIRRCAPRRLLPVVTPGRTRARRRVCGGLRPLGTRAPRLTQMPGRGSRVGAIRRGSRAVCVAGGPAP